MTRVSNDLYRLADGTLTEISPADPIPEGAILWHGYDYVRQQWVHEGKPDTRTLEELQSAILKSP